MAATMPAAALGQGFDCTAPLGDGGTHSVHLRVAGLFGILATSAIGIYLPLLARGRYPSALFLGRAFGSGVVLATGFVHVMVDSFNDLTNPCLGFSSTYPWSMVIAAFAALTTFSLEMALTAFFRRRLTVKAFDMCPTSSRTGQLMELEVGMPNADTKEIDGDPKHFSDIEHAAKVEELNILVISYVLEAGMIFHSFTIGLAFGANTDTNVLVALIIALSFHQSLDGVALGATFAAAGYSKLKYFWFAIAFVLVTPTGVAIGLIIGEKAYHPNSPAVLGAQGVLNAISAGILIFNGLVDLMLPTFGESSSTTKQRSTPLTLAGLASMFLGCGAMCIVAKWA